MIDFKSEGTFKLKPTDLNKGTEAVGPLLIDGEEVSMTFQTVRDLVVFTNKRLITINVQGLGGKKRDFTSLPYSKVQAFSVETAGTFDRDGEMELWFSGLGKIRLEFAGKVDIKALSNYIGAFILK